jgi:hypothetical protein
MSAKLIERLMDVVESVDLDQPDDEFVAAAHALHALAISKLPANEREKRLQTIEDGALRLAVGLFPNCHGPRLPEAPGGYLN